ncbi:MAG TPA: hypothetical protein VM264_05240 [Acidimicrobiales bacterium]|nr:hypothetical protein [Acidimicrobiales bacterium]
MSEYGRPGLRALAKPERAEVVDPGEAALEVTVRNDAGEPVRFNRHQASHPALVLQVRDERDRPVLLAPPSAPGAEDLVVEELGPGQSVLLRYAGFLDRSLDTGTYRVRYFSPYPHLGGTEEAPLSTDWVPISVHSTQAFRPGVELPQWPPPFPRPPTWSVPLRLSGKLVDVLARRLGFLACQGVLEQEIDEQRTETISNAPPGSEAWNGTYGWRARFLVRVEEASCRVSVTIRIRLVGTITSGQRSAWESAIRDAWSGLFKVCANRQPCCVNGFPIHVAVQFVTSGEHQVVNVGTSTTNMGNWGATDTVDVSHEAGHMLGALDEYFTVNGVDYGLGRQADGAIMNNPANPPAARHYDLILQAVRGLTGGAGCTQPVSAMCG